MHTFCIANRERKLMHVNFQIELVKGLLQQASEEIEALSADPATQSAVRGEAAPPPLCLTGRHSPERCLLRPVVHPANLSVWCAAKGKGEER